AYHTAHRELLEVAACGHQVQAVPRSQSSSRPMTRRRISEVPPPGSKKRASRKYRWTGYSMARPYEAKMRAASSVTLTAISEAKSFVIAASRVIERPASRPAAACLVLSV